MTPAVFCLFLLFTSDSQRERFEQTMCYRREQEQMLGIIHVYGMMIMRGHLGSSQAQNRPGPTSWLGQQRRNVGSIHWVCLIGLIVMSVAARPRTPTLMDLGMRRPFSYLKEPKSKQDTLTWQLYITASPIYFKYAVRKEIIKRNLQVSDRKWPMGSGKRRLWSYCNHFPFTTMTGLRICHFDLNSRFSPELLPPPRPLLSALARLP